jgi:hypothetical protein
MRRIALGALALLLAAAPARAQEDDEGCKDHPLFTRFPNSYIVDCASSQFDLRKFPVGQMKPGEEVSGPSRSRGRPGASASRSRRGRPLPAACS